MAFTFTFPDVMMVPDLSKNIGEGTDWQICIPLFIPFLQGVQFQPFEKLNCANFKLKEKNRMITY